MPKSKKKYAACWEKLEKFNNEKFPECVKTLLEKAAYDRLNSLKSIDAAKIADIETYLSEQRSSWINELNCCQSDEYKNQESFRFLPGHKSIVLSIPDQIKQMSVEKTNVHATKTKTKLKNESNDQALISHLISNLVQYVVSKQKFTIPDGIITEKNIRQFERGTASDTYVCKCKFVCPFCPIEIPVRFTDFWRSSNVTKHLKSHIEIEYVNVQQDQSTNEILNQGEDNASTIELNIDAIEG